MKSYEILCWCSATHNFSTDDPIVTNAANASSAVSWSEVANASMTPSYPTQLELCSHVVIFSQ